MKAFTLIELLAVIVILAIISLIAVPIVINIINDSKKSSETENIKLYLDTINKLVTKENLMHKYDPDYCVVIDKVTLTCYSDSKNIGNIKINLKENKIDEGFLYFSDGKISIARNLLLNGLYYQVEKGKIKERKIKNPEIFVDLPDGMLPVIYEESTWKVVSEEDDNWYNYDEQKWANAVILKKDVQKKVGDSVSLSNEVLGMFVYIPRYEYKIEGAYGKNGTGVSNPGEVEVKFSNKFQKTSDIEEYIVPAGFTFGTDELNGIWISKFEPSKSDNIIYVLPGKYSLRQNNTLTEFKYSQYYNDYIKNGDSHMLKNSEWATMAYLSQSKYGKYGNSIYTGSNKEIYQNKNTSYKTGYSNGTPSQSTKIQTQCYYDDIADRGNGIGACGAGASTTGNIYGIYDTSGGAWTKVMSLLANEDNIPIIGESKGSTSGFSGLNGNGEISEGEELPNLKYYDLYKVLNSKVLYNDLNDLGHSFSETKKWYNDHSNLIRMGSPWVIRGGESANSNDAGIFNFSDGMGNSSEYRTFLITIVSN